MRIESVQFFRYWWRCHVSKVILRKWGLKETNSPGIWSVRPVSKVILRKWGLKGNKIVHIIHLLLCFKGHTQKMRIERTYSCARVFSYHTRFKGHTQKMRIERCERYFHSLSRKRVSKVILRKWGLKVFKSEFQQDIEEEFQRSYSENEDWKASTLVMLFSPLVFQRSYSENEDWKASTLVMLFSPLVFQRSYSENEDWKAIMSVLPWHFASFQRSYSENEDWKFRMGLGSLQSGQVSKVILRKWGLKASCLQFLQSGELRFKGHTQKMRIERWVSLPHLDIL